MRDEKRTISGSKPKMGWVGSISMVARRAQPADMPRRPVRMLAPKLKRRRWIRFARKSFQVRKGVEEESDLVALVVDEELKVNREVENKSDWWREDDFEKIETPKRVAERGVVVVRRCIGDKSLDELRPILIMIAC